MHPSMAILADLGDIITGLVTIAVPIIFVLSQIFGNRKKPVAPPRQRRVPRAQPARPREVDDEVEQFLRRVANRRAGGQAEEVVVARPEPPPVRRIVDEVVAAEVIETPSIPRSTIAQRHLDPSIHSANDPSERLSHLDQADEDVEEHLHEVFDHKLGRLTEQISHVDSTVGDAYERRDDSPYQDEPGQVDLHGNVQQIAGTPTMAAGLAAMLSNSENLKQAIVLSEIINRPEHRW